MMRVMVNLCEFYGYTPAQVRACTLRDLNALIHHMNDRRRREAEAANA